MTSSTIERVIVPTNESEVAELALGYALDAFPNGTITVLTVVGEPSATFGGAAAIALADDPGKPADEYAQPVLDRAREIAEEYGAEIDTEVKTGLPVRGIINRAGDFDTVVIGRHAGSSSDRLFVGDVAEKGIRGSPVPVTVVRQRRGSLAMQLPVGKPSRRTCCNLHGPTVTP